MGNDVEHMTEMKVISLEVPQDKMVSTQLQSIDGGQRLQAPPKNKIMLVRVRTKVSQFG